MAVVELMQSSQVHMDRRLLDACNGAFETVCKSGVTRLKPSTSLSSLLNLSEEEGTRARVKIETTMDDLKSVSC